MPTHSMRSPVVVWGSLALLLGIGCADQPSSTTLERTLAEAIQAEIYYPFAEPEAVLKDNEVPGRVPNLGAIAKELGVRVDSLEEDHKVHPPVAAYLTIGVPRQQRDGSIVVPVKYVSLGPPEGENAVAIVWDVTLRKTAGDWSYERVVERMVS